MNELIQVAARIKNAQPDVQEKRRRWEALPEFLQLTFAIDTPQLQTLRSSSSSSSSSSADRLAFVDACRVQGNALFERALATTKSATTTTPNGDGDGAAADDNDNDNNDDDDDGDEDNNSEAVLRDAVLQYCTGLSVYVYVKRVGNEGDIEVVHSAYTADGNGAPLVTLYANLGACYLKLKKYGTCESACREALRLDAQHSKCWYRLACAVRAMDRDAEAIKCLKSAIECAPAASSPGLQRQLRVWQRAYADDRARQRAAFKPLAKGARLYSDEENNAMAHGGGGATATAATSEDKFLEDFARDDLKVPEARVYEEVVRLKVSAKKFGLDLRDPMVRDELVRLSDEKTAHVDDDEDGNDGGGDATDELGYPTTSTTTSVKRRRAARRANNLSVPTSSIMPTSTTTRLTRVFYIIGFVLIFRMLVVFWRLVNLRYKPLAPAAPAAAVVDEPQ